MLRPARIDLRRGERVVRSVVRAPGPLGLADLARLVDEPAWLAVDGDLVTLRAGLLQAPDTHLIVEAPAVTRLRLAQSAGRSSWLKGSRARLAVVGVEVVGWDVDRAAPADPGPDRPFIAYTNGAQVEVRGSAFNALGRAGGAATGVGFSRASVVVTDSSFTGNAVGLAFTRPAALALDGIRIRGSAGSGLVVEEPTGGVVQRVVSEANGSHGVAVTHPGQGLRLAGVDVASNAGVGLLLDSQRDVVVRDVSSSGNAGASVQVKSGRDVTLATVRSTGDAEGVVLSGKTARVLLRDAELRGSNTGVSVGAGTSEVSLRRVSAVDIAGSAFELAGRGHVLADSSVDNASVAVDLGNVAESIVVSELSASRVATGLIAKRRVDGLIVQDVAVKDAEVGLSLAGKRIVVRAGTLTRVKTGVRVYGAAASVSLDRTVISDTAVGVLTTSGTRDVTLTDLAVKQETGIGIVASSPDLRVVGGELTGGLIGLELHGTDAVVAGTTITARDGITVGKGSRVVLSDARVDAVATALRVGPGGRAEVRTSRLWAVAATDGPGSLELIGQNEVPPTPLPWYGVAALVAAGSAVVLELVRRLRETEAEWVAPVAAHVTNRA